MLRTHLQSLLNVYDRVWQKHGYKVTRLWHRWKGTVTRPNLSIRATLLAIIALLNILIATQIGFNLYKSWVNHQKAAALEDSAGITATLYNTQKHLSLERGASIAILYVSKERMPKFMEDLSSHRRQTDRALADVMRALDERKEDYFLPEFEQVRDSYERLQRYRARLDAALAQPKGERDLDLPEDIFTNITVLITNIENLIEVYSRPYLALHPNFSRQMRFTHIIWNITEYAGREYAILGKMIAENAVPSPLQQEELFIWRGRIQYGWEIAHAAVLNSAWGKELLPYMEEAEINYFMTFEQIKESFYAATPSSRRQIYPITAQTWLETAAQAVQSLHSMNDFMMTINQRSIIKMKDDAEMQFILGLMLLVSAITLSVYSWKVITERVIKPVNSMANALYQATQGQEYQMPPITYYHDEIGKLANVLTVLQENSLQLQKERDNARAASIAKSEFLANMSHEIRTPMNVIVGLANILMRSSPLTDKQQEFVRTLQLSAESLLSIINDLLDISKIETQKIELEKIPFHMAEMVEDISSLIRIRAQEKGLDFVVEVSDIEGKEYIGDPTRIRQILLNLCGNAVKFTEKGSVALKVQSFPNMHSGMEDIYISVSDTGIGIAPDKLDYIFEKFTQADSTITRKYGGTGLGLAISKTFVEMMRGKITAQSVLGRGSTFVVHLALPARVEIQSSKSKILPVKKIPIQAEHTQKKNAACVLLVEDYRPNAMVAGIYLEQFGFEYEVAENGLEAVEKVKNKKYHAILMDIQMQGLDGYQTTQAIRKFEKDSGREQVKIIGVTAHALNQDRDKCLRAGMNDYLSKPFTADDLKQKLVGQG